jgi:hypothetical protein
MSGGGAAFSPDRTYRYALYRYWGGMFSSGFVNLIGLNPSTADAESNDNTIRRCIGFAKAWGYSALCMTNLFAFCTSDPEIMKAFKGDPVGPENDFMILEHARKADLVVGAWGTDGDFMGRAQGVAKLLFVAGIQLHALKATKDGHPAHPLYLPKRLKPAPWMK